MGSLQTNTSIPSKHEPQTKTEMFMLFFTCEQINGGLSKGDSLHNLGP